MKILIVLLLLLLIAFGCKKHIETPTNKLILGLDPSVKLPNADTIGALSYIEGYINGERFCLAEGKDSVLLVDVASSLFGYDYKPEWKQNGIGAAWFFQQGTRGYQEPPKKGWYLEFWLPTFSSKRDSSEFNAFKKKYLTPSTFTNFDACGQTIEALEQFRLNIFRTDLFNGQWNNVGLGSCGDVSRGVKLDQTGSYIKLVSVGKRVSIPFTNYHYELIYEFDIKLLGGTGVLHLTKGRMKTWLMGMKI